MNPDTMQNEKEATSPFEAILLKFLAIIFFAAILVAGYLFLSQYISHIHITIRPKVTSQKVKLINPIATVTPTDESYAFQQMLSNSCSKVTSKLTDFYTIDPKILPITLKQPEIQLLSDQQKASLCEGDDRKRYVMLTTGNNTSIYLYDKNSEELAQIGYSLFKPLSFAQTFYNANDITLSFFLAQPSPIIIKETPIVIRGTKKIHLPNGGIIYATSDVIAISKIDSRLIKLLSNFSLPSSMPGKSILDQRKQSEYMDTIKNTFFSSITSLSDPEKTYINQLLTLLNAISAK